MRLALLFVAALIVIGATTAILLAPRNDSADTVGDPAAVTVAAEVDRCVRQSRAPDVLNPIRTMPFVESREEREHPTPTMACAVKGRVLHGNGDAVAGAEITVSTAVHPVVSGEDGRFVVVKVAVEPTVRLAVTHNGRAGLLRYLTLWPGAEIDIGDLVLHAEARIRGVVLNPAGLPVSTASVGVKGGDLVATDENGAFEIGGLGAGRHYLRAEATGYATRPAMPIDVSEGETVEDVELGVDRARFLTGRVGDRDGAPIVGAAVSTRVKEAWVDGPAPRATSQDGGLFKIGPFGEGTVNLVVTHELFMPFGRMYPTDALPLEIRLTATRAVYGRVVDATTREAVAITEAQLLVSSGTDAGPWKCLGQPVRLPAGQEVDGRFRIPLGIHCMARVVVLSEDHAPAVSDPFWMGHQSVGPLEVRALPGVRLRGVVRDEEGAPVPHAEIHVLAPIGEDSLAQTGAAVVLSRQQTAEDGTFETAPLAPDRYSVTAQRTGYVPADRKIDMAELCSQPILITAPRAGTIRGRLLDRENTPRRVRVVATRLDGLSGPKNPRRRLPSAKVQSGRFLFEALEPGRYRLQVLGLARGEDGGCEPAVVEVAVSRESYVELRSSRQDSGVVDQFHSARSGA